MQSERPTLPPCADPDEIKSQRFLREWREIEREEKYGSRVLEACALARLVNGGR